MMVLRDLKITKAIVIILLTCLPIFFMPEITLLAQQQQEGEELLKQGKQDYIEGRFEEAVEKLSLALKLLTDKDKLIDAHLHIGLCHFALGNKDKAKEQLVEILRLNPAQRLDPLYYPPDFINLLDEARTGILGQLKVESDPSIAQVFIDGEFIGITPVEITEIAAGEHTLRIVKQGFKERGETFVLKVGEKKTVTMNLEKETEKIKEEEEEKPKVTTTPAEKKPEVKKKSNTMMWVLLGGAAAAAVLLLAARGGGESKSEPTPTPTPAGEPTLNLRIKVIFSMSNMEAHWKILIDDDIVFDEWLISRTRGGDDPVFNEITRFIPIQRRPGSFRLKLWGYESFRIFPESPWIRSTKFEISIVGPASEMNRYRVDPDSFYLKVAPFKATDPVNWPRERTKTINLLRIGTTETLSSQGQELIQAVKEKNP
jgi:hypothetical protein